MSGATNVQAWLSRNLASRNLFLTQTFQGDSFWRMTFHHGEGSGKLVIVSTADAGVRLSYAQDIPEAVLAIVRRICADAYTASRMVAVSDAVERMLGYKPETKKKEGEGSGGG